MALDWLNYTYLIGFYVLIFIFLLAYKDIIFALKRVWLRNKVIKIEFVNSDGTRTFIYAKRKGAELEYKEKRFYINPKKTLLERGMKVATYVMDNALSHDYFLSPKEILDKIVKESKKKKIRLYDKKLKRYVEKEVDDVSESMHDIYSEPFKIDAKLMQEAIKKAELSSSELFSKLFALMRNPNIIMWIMGGAIGIIAAAVLSWLIYNEIMQGTVKVICTNIGEAIIKTS